MKKLGMIFGALIGLLLLAIIIIPLVVDVDKYRPQITEAVNEKLNGQFELGHLQLSLWGHIRVEIAGLSLKDAQGKGVVSVKDASFFLPFFPLLSGSPVVDLQMDSPSVEVTKNRTGKLNLMTLMKTQAVAEAPAAPQGAQATAPSKAGKPEAQAKGQAPQAEKAAPPQAAPAPAPVAAAKPTEIPAIAARARLGFQLLHANVTYKDETSGMAAEMKDLNILIKDLSLSRPSEISIWSDFDTQMGKTLSVKGPGRVDLTLSPKVIDGKLAQFTLGGKADFDALEISVPGTFQKNKGVAANVELAVSGSDKEAKIEKMDVNFFNAQIKSSGTVSNIQAAPTVRYSMKSNDIDLKSWVELLPMLKAYELGGKANFSADVGGQADKISYQAKLGLIGLTAKAPNLKAQPRIDGEVVVTTDQVQSILLTMKAPGNDLKITGKVLSFKAPQITVDVTSPGMDLDQLIDFAAAPPAKTTKLELVHEAYAEATEKQQDLDAMLDPLRENKMMAMMSANVGFNLKMLKAKNMKMTDMVGKLYFKDLAAGLENFSMKLFNGTIKANVSSQLKPKAPTYKFSANVAGLDLSEAVKSQAAMFKNTMTGTANFDMSGEGASFNTVPAEANLKAKGSMKIANAEFASLDVSKMVVDGIASVLSSVSSKIPGLVGKYNPPNVKSRYELVSSDFGIQGGKFSAPNFVGKAVPNQGIDLKGSVNIGLKEQSLDAKFQIIDTYNVTKVKDYSPMLCEKGKPFVMPVSAGCTLAKPCYSYADSASFIGKIVANNELGNVKQQGVDQLKKALGGGGGAPNLGALKGLFGH